MKDETPRFTMPSLSLNPAQAREILPELVGFINRNDMMDDYTQRIAKRVDPEHAHVWVLQDVGLSHLPIDEGFEGTYYLMAFCPACWKNLRLHFEVFNGSAYPLDDLSRKCKGLDRYKLHDQFEAFCHVIVKLFPKD